MWQERQAGFLREEIVTLLAPLIGTGDLLWAIQDSLTAQLGATTNYRPEPAWSLLPMIVCESVCGDGDRAIPAAAAILLFKTAADVFDDVEDADTSESVAAKSGAAVAINVATALLFIAEMALARLKVRGVSDADIIAVTEKVNSYHLKACSGQHLDIVFSGDTLISEDRYLKMIEMKTASQLECSCFVGALLGNGNDEMIDIFSHLGRCLGMAAQIANDIRGATDGNDIVKRKISLPTIYALANANGPARDIIEAMFGKNGDSVTYADKIKEMLFQTGAIQYAMIKMETYRQEGQKRLLEAKKIGARVERLEPFFQ